MHSSSESVAALATALAKAQMELSNPEKSMIGTIHHLNRADNPQTFRYAPLSSGLEIVRKTLGAQQIAVVQSTDIDRTHGVVNLKTMLMHTSGEWISSDWPVCQLSETAAPRRMGAALTYARRYALFTLVGIAGEDDLDSLDCKTTTLGIGGDAIPVNSRSNELRNPQPRAAKQAVPLQQQKSDVDHSATKRDEIKQRIEGIASIDDLQNHAPEILKAKNSLLPVDAKVIEDVFSAQMSKLGSVLPSASLLDACPAEPDGQATQQVTSNTSGISKPRRRKRAVADRVKSELAISQVSELAKKVSRSRDETRARAIDKSVLTLSEPRRKRDKAHLRFVASQPCLICGRAPSDAHHLRFAQPRAMACKTSDEFTVPLCRTHHRDNHRHGNERAWWLSTSSDPLQIAQKLWTTTRNKTVE